MQNCLYVEPSVEMKPLFRATHARDISCDNNGLAIGEIVM